MIIPPAPYSYTGEVTTVEAPTLSGIYTYNGNEQIPVWNYNENAISIFGQTSGVNAGSYDVTFSLNSKRAYQWSDGTKADKTGTWSIGKAQNTITFDPTSLSLTYYDKTGTVSVSYLGDGKLSYSINNDNVTVLKNENEFNVTALKTGDSVITANVSEGTNYLSTSGTFNVAVDMAKNFTVTVNSDDSDMGSVSGGGTVKEGNSITVTATANTGYKFAGWQVDGETVSTAVHYTFTPTDDIDLTAIFVELPVYTVTVNVEPEDSGTVTGDGQYYEGDSVTVTATATDGMKLSNWAIDGVEVGTNESYTFTITNDVEITATFETFSRLPDGYTELQYITLNGNKTSFELVEAINGYYDRIVFNVYPTDYGTSSNNKYMLDCRDSTSSYLMLRSAGSNSLRTYINSTTASSTSIPIVDTLLSFDIDFYNNSYSVNGNILSGIRSSKTFSTFKCIFGTSAVSTTAGRFYKFLHYKNGDLIHEYVPCTNQSGVHGIFDLNTNKFIQNTYPSGTSITAGPSV